MCADNGSTSSKPLERCDNGYRASLAADGLAAAWAPYPSAEGFLPGHKYTFAGASRIYARHLAVQDDNWHGGLLVNGV